MDISFQQYRKNDIHGLSPYPATMIAPVQKTLMQWLFEREEITSVFDPFHGSGTSLYEAMLLNKDCEIIGCDLNPLAHLITITKLKGVTLSINSDIDRLFELIEIAPEKKFYFNNIEKWYRPDFILSLNKIRWSIIKIKSKRNRLFFWSAFSSILRKYSNTRSSTYKLHIKEQNTINKMSNNIIKDFRKLVVDNADKFKQKSKKVTLYKEDFLKRGKKLYSNSFDLTITSPPYGDNQTTVPYGQFSSLALFWIDKKDLKIDGWELENYSILDRKSLGGSAKNSIKGSDYHYIEPYLNKISSKKQKKVINFFSDYFISLSNIGRVTKKYIVMTLGNRTVDGININLTEITKNYLIDHGFKDIFTLDRNIPNKRIPQITSLVNDKPVSSMNTEYVIIMEKVLQNSMD